MGSWTEFDPRTGITEKCAYDESTGALLISKTQDCSALVDRNKELKATRATTRGDIWQQCSIPVGVQYELLWKHKVDITKREDWPRMFYLIETEYPDLKTTDKKFFLKNGGRKTIVS